MPNLYEFDSRDFVELYPRDFRSRITPTSTQRTTLIVGVCYIVGIAILWYVNDVMNNNVAHELPSIQAHTVSELDKYGSKYASCMS